MPKGYFFFKQISYQEPIGLFLEGEKGCQYVPIDVNRISALARRIGQLRFNDMIESQLQLANQELDGMNPFNGGLLPTHTERQRKGIQNAKTLYERILNL